LHVPEPPGGDRAYVLALGSGRPIQTVVLLRSNVDFGSEPAQRRCERDDLDDRGRGVEQALCGHLDRHATYAFAAWLRRMPDARQPAVSVAIKT
jgi:hypothetical protein